MPLHHYLPATFLASFSLDSSTVPRRKRHLYVGDKQEDRVFHTSAANTGAIQNLYTLVLTGEDPDVIDRTWAGYEAKLSEAITLLIAGEVDARTWVRVLVPFVACMLVRGPDFDKRFERRISALGIDPEAGHVSKDNTNLARLLELQRLLGPVVVAKWVMLRVKGEELLITNDLGYAPFVNRATREAGIAIPLSLSHALAVIPRNEGRIAVGQSGKWVPDIEHVDNMPDNHEGLNRALSSTAQRFIFGPDETVRKWLQGSSASSFAPEPEQLGFIAGTLARAHEFNWHRLAVALERDPSDGAPWDFPLDWERLAQGWTPPVFFPSNLVEFPPSLHREGRSIRAEFYEPELYYALSRVQNFERLGNYKLLLEEAAKGLSLAQDDTEKVRFLTARAAALGELQRCDEALRDYNEALRLDPQSVIAMTNRAVTFLKLGELDAATQDLERALLLDPNHGVARLNRGNIHNLRNESDSPVREITRALESLPIGPEQGAAHLSRGNAHLMLGNYREAIGDFSVAAKCFPDTKPKAFCELRKAKALLDSGDHDGAFKAIEASLELDDESYEAHMFKGQLSLKHGNTKDAIAELTQVLKLGAPDSTVSQALNLRAEVYTNLGHFNLALRDYDRAVELDRGSSAIHYNRGNVLLLTGDVDAAIEAFNHALELDHRNAGALNSRGIAYALQGAFELAIEDHREATLIFGRSEAAGSAFRNLALCYAIAGNTNSAAESVRWARELDADSLFNEQVEGLVCLYQGRFSDSLALLSRVASNQNDRPDLKLYLSLPHAFLGDTDEARSLAEECLGKLNPPIIKIQFTTHLRALRDRFPEEKEFIAFSQTFSR